MWFEPFHASRFNKTKCVVIGILNIPMNDYAMSINIEQCKLNSFQHFNSTDFSMTGPPMTNSLISFVFVRIQFMRLVVVLIHLNNFEKPNLRLMSKPAIISYKTLNDSSANRTAHFWDKLSIDFRLSWPSQSLSINSEQKQQFQMSENVSSDVKTVRESHWRLSSHSSDSKDSHSLFDNFKIQCGRCSLI